MARFWTLRRKWQTAILLAAILVGIGWGWFAGVVAGIMGLVALSLYGSGGTIRYYLGIGLAVLTGIVFIVGLYMGGTKAVAWIGDKFPETFGTQPATPVSADEAKAQNTLDSLNKQIEAKLAELKNIGKTDTGTTQEQPAVITGEMFSGTDLNWVPFVEQYKAGTFANFYDLREWLDRLPQKKDHPAGGWTTSCQALVWSGIYVNDPTLGGRAKAFPLNDGLTGAYVIEQGTTVPTPGGEICISGYDGNIPFVLAKYDRPSVEVSASECVDAAKVNAIISGFKDVNNDAIFAGLDSMVDAQPGIRLMVNGAGSFDTTNALVWTSGNVTGSSQMIIKSNGKTLYATGGEISVDHAFSGMKLCGPMQGTTLTSTSIQKQPAQDGNTNTTGMCIPAATMAELVTKNRSANNAQTLYPALKTLADQNPSAVIKGGAGTVKVYWLKSFLWVEDGATGDLEAIDTSANNSLWLARSDGEAQVKANYTMFMLCSDLNPDRDWEWWQ